MFRLELDNFPELDSENIELVLDLNFGAEPQKPPSEKFQKERQQEKLSGSVSLGLKKVPMLASRCRRAGCVSTTSTRASRTI